MPRKSDLSLLNQGIRLFGGFETERMLALEQTLSYSGIVELIYERRYTKTPSFQTAILFLMLVSLYFSGLPL